MAFVFYDTETSGLETSFDQILQFAAIKTDADLNIVDRIDIRSRLQPHVIPSPYALRVTGMTIERLLDPETPSHYTMVRELRNKLLDWSPAVFLGYNSMKFDENLLRQALYQTLHSPYLTQTGGNSRTDVLPLVQSATQFAPTLFKLPINEKGKPSFKLDMLAPANGFAHDNAHDALADVEATIHLCKMIKGAMPQLWDRAISHSSKQPVASFLENNQAFVLSQFWFNKPYNYPVTSIGSGNGLPNNKLCVLLAIDPEEYLHKDVPELCTFIKKSPKPIRSVKINSAPSVFALNEVPEHFLGDLDVSEINRRADVIQRDIQLQQRLHAAHNLNMTEYEKSEHPEEQIYDGFPSSIDESLMNQFHAANWEERLALCDGFADERLRFFAKRLMFFERPDLVSQPLTDYMNAHIAQRMGDGGKWTSVAKALEDTDELTSESSGSDLELLMGYRNYLAQHIQH